MTGKGVLGALYSSKGAGEKTLGLVKMPANLGSHIYLSPNNTLAGPLPVPYTVFQRLREPHFSPVICSVLEAPYGDGFFIMLLVAPIKYLFLPQQSAVVPSDIQVIYYEEKQLIAKRYTTGGVCKL